MKKITLYTDGACSGNPGPGGWGCILQYNDYVKEMSGFCESTTNNQMELLAIISGLEALKEPCEVEVYSDSAYVVNAFNLNWIVDWQLNGWKNSKKEVVKNIPLWEQLLSLTQIHKITFNKVKGHDNDEKNNRCDFLATNEIAKHKNH